ncbi:phosphonatase-like hydrolase [Dyadobacter jejuensis]|uniref:Phosphonatase-like hydrolase n=1 Tax=Dyadobacter jejuensis TaxID=1082580 RepID=A0A316AS93_9BACT|nr:HAD-IA family hydrolase [Dyadobacter jejuensis]PWJ60565.1 phosphonatase-like hydrolase [Dyadobacter jejuensis]
MAIELVVFDMAGTTVKDRNYVGQAFQQAMKFYGYDVPVAEVNPIMGYEKPVAIRMMLEKQGVEEITDLLVDQIHQEFVERMMQFYRESDDIVALPGVEDTFAILKEAGIKIALNTGFSRNIAEVIVGRLGWEKKIDLLVASDEVAHGRPYPDMIQKIMATLGVESATNVVKVGDTEVDINEAKNAGCALAIGITTGAFTREELLPYEPTHILDRIDGLLEILQLKTKAL